MTIVELRRRLRECGSLEVSLLDLRHRRRKPGSRLLLRGSEEPEPVLAERPAERRLESLESHTEIRIRARHPKRAGQLSRLLCDRFDLTTRNASELGGARSFLRDRAGSEDV